MRDPRYGPEHDREIRRWIPLIASGTVPCVLCGRVILPGKIRVGGKLQRSWDLDHIPGTTRYRGPAHMRCNRRDGAIRGNIMRGARRRRREAVRRTWGDW
jgi:hypothetical protein